MIVHITREACCSQDDQLGPLEIQLEFDENATLEQVIKEICRLKFLQYSSSPNSTTPELFFSTRPKFVSTILNSAFRATVNAG